MNGQPTLVCFAMKEEVGPFRRMAEGWPHVSILVTGMGRMNTERSLRRFLENNSPSVVFTCGLAGGLNPELSRGDVIFATDHAGLKGRLSAAGARPVRFHCATKIATTVAEKQELRRSTNADAVEMESEVIQEICRGRGIPCATVRVISDTAQEDLPLDFNKLAKPDLSIDYGRLAMAILKKPSKIRGLMQLQKNTAFAARQLAEVLAKVVAP